MKTEKIAVRTLVEQVLRRGSIDNRYADSAAMQDGAAAHRRIQREMDAGYQKEVALAVQTEIAGIPVIIHGRADGVFERGDGTVFVDEIKTTNLPLDKLFLQHEMHLAQAQCYAYILLSQAEEPPTHIGIQLTYFQMETEETARRQWIFSAEEIEAFFQGLLASYSVWLRFSREWAELRNNAIKQTDFPFPRYRKGQRELAVAVYRTIENGKKLYAQAPTGIGKTLSALFPSVKAMGEEKAEKLFYLTAKTVTRTVAEDAVRLLLQNSLRLKSITLRAKDKLCFCEETICNPEYCPYADGHYDRVNGAVLDIIQHEDLITPETITRYAQQHRVCPHETALDVSLWCDLVIGDYNHVFDPSVYLRRFFADNEKHQYVFLIDEAHNLADRVRDMYTASLSKSDFVSLKKTLTQTDRATKNLKNAASQINALLLGFRKEHEGEKSLVIKELNTDLSAKASLFLAAAEEWLGEHSGTRANEADEMADNVLELYFTVAAFVLMAEGYGEHYTSIYEISGNDLTITLFCLDPSGIIAEKLRFGTSAVLFSATLTPLPYHRDVLGGNEEDFLLSLPSPFEQQNLLLCAHCGISTKYVHREQSYEPIARLIYETVSHMPGNYLAFFPSYDYMHEVYSLFIKHFGHVKTLLQGGSMKEDERLMFLQEFDEANTGPLIGFCVLGGIFSEGIDLKGRRLIGSLIVGVGLPKLSLRQDLIRDYYNEKNGSGYDYAYVFPGMNKVLQAAGRVIRTETDTGMVLLIDSRFGTAQYRALYPPFWSHMKQLRKTEDLKALLAHFGQET
ncbi:MAG: PD-(D/E)XK nuclease family protein [Oscillospiraceae bacterium]|jgi:Rad3-related DNA helicase|nr:PD-(D/E)XK nuclease family protein [Oscillospiraceae bacterium]